MDWKIVLMWITGLRKIQLIISHCPNRFYGFGKTRYSSTLKYEKGSFVKVRDVTLAYNIPSKVLASLGLGRARIYATAKISLPSAALIITIQNEGEEFHFR